MMTLQDLDHYQDFEGKSVVLRGFIYQSADGRSILASQPHLQSCCVGNPLHSQQQIELIGDIEQMSSSRAMTLEGRLMVFQRADESGGMTMAFQLHGARLVESSVISGHCLICWASIVLLISASVAIFWRRKVSY